MGAPTLAGGNDRSRRAVPGGDDAPFFISGQGLVDELVVPTLGDSTDELVVPTLGDATVS